MSLLVNIWLYKTIVSGNCALYPTESVCSPYMTYNSVFLPENVTFATLESELPQMSNYTLNAAITPDCFDAFMSYKCIQKYPKCIESNNVTESFSACPDACPQINARCGVMFEMMDLSYLLPNCSQDATSNSALEYGDTCTPVTSKLNSTQFDVGQLNYAAIPTRYILNVCPDPFVRDPLASPNSTATANPQYCHFGCCIPCPAQNLFYPKGWAERGFNATGIIRFISAILAFFMAVSYLVLPGKRDHPGDYIFNLVISTFIFNIAGVLSLVKPERVQCTSNGVSSANFENNKLCVTQGTFIIFGSFAMCLWTCALIASLHLKIVWKSNILRKRPYLVDIVCWGVPVIFTATVLGQKAISFSISNVCWAETGYIFSLVFYPLTGISMPFLFMHLVTFCKIIIISVKGNKEEEEMTQSSEEKSYSRNQLGRQVAAAVKIQWRALLLAVSTPIITAYYWLFSIVSLNHLVTLYKDPALINEWLVCTLVDASGQDVCSTIFNSYIPTFRLMILAQVLISCLGITTFIIFFKPSFLTEWRDWFYNFAHKRKERIAP